MSIRESIIHETLRLFSLKGFSSTSITDILEATGASKGGFYNHFKSKEELFYAVLKHARQIWREKVLTGLDQVEPPLEKICKLLENHRDLYHILMDWQVVKFLTRRQYERSDRLCPRDDKIEMIERAIRNGQTLEIVYLKAKDEKSRRKVRPLFVGGMEYSGHPFTGLEAVCLLRGKKRVFNVDRILEIHGC